MVNTKHIPKSVVPAGDLMLPHPQFPSFYAVIFSRKSRGVSIALDPVAQYHHLKNMEVPENVVPPKWVCNGYSQDTGPFIPATHPSHPSCSLQKASTGPPRGKRPTIHRLSC